MAELVIICDAHLTEDIARLAFKGFFFHNPPPFPRANQ